MKGKQIAKSHKPFHSSTSHMRANRLLGNWAAAFAFDILNENDRLTEVEHTVLYYLEHVLISSVTRNKVFEPVGHLRHIMEVIET